MAGVGQRTRPHPLVFYGIELSGMHLDSSRTNSNGDRWVGAQVLEPSWILRVSSLDRNDDVADAIRHVAQRRRAPRSALRSNVVE